VHKVVFSLFGETFLEQMVFAPRCFKFAVVTKSLYFTLKEG